MHRCHALRGQAAQCDELRGHVACGSGGVCCKAVGEAGRTAAQAPGLVRSVVELPLATTVDRGCCAVVEAVACSGRVRSRVVGAVARIMPRRWEWPHEGVGEDAGRRDPVFVKTAVPETWRGTLTGCVSCVQAV